MVLDILAVTLLAGSLVLILSAIRVNPYFHIIGRNREVPGQKVVTAGPYRVVRHPAYSGGIISWIAFAGLMRSRFYWILAAAGILYLVIRTAREDRRLFKSIAEYPAYAKQVRYRVIPGIW